MISVSDFKDYLIAKGFSINGPEFIKEYPMPPVEGETESKKVKLKYVIERPWVKGLRINSIGQQVLFAKGKLKNMSIGEDGVITGFLVKSSEGGKQKWI